MTSTAAPDQQDGMLLPGLDGSNPLGFLAALGVLWTVDTHKQRSPIRVQWQESRGTWIPRIYGGGRDIDDLVNCLITGFDGCNRTPWMLDKKLPFEADRLRDEVLNAIFSASQMCRDRVDTLGSFGVEGIKDANGVFKDTSLRMVRAGDSAGNGLLAYGKRIQDETTADDLRSTLTGPWRYEDEGCALRWDPAEHHGYAMQWTDPSKEKTVSVRGANRLALAAMPTLPTIPRQAKAETVAFGKPDNRQECLTWPLWRVPCDLRVVKSLLALASLQDEQPDALELYELGVGAVYRCGRIMTSTYYRNFTPAQRIA